MSKVAVEVVVGGISKGMPITKVAVAGMSKGLPISKEGKCWKCCKKIGHLKTWF